MKKRLTIFVALLLLLFTISGIKLSSSMQNIHSCDCVAFRLDDVQDYYLVNVNMEVIKVFQEKNASLTIGIVGNYFGEDKSLLSFLENRINVNNPVLEISNHGWNHEDFRRFSLKEQYLLLERTNERINRILGVTPLTFITPFDIFNNDTLTAVNQIGMKYISSFTSNDTGPYGQYDTGPPYHFPATATTSNNNDTYWWGIKHNETLGQIKNSIRNYGFAVVEMHPYEYSNKKVYHTKPFDPDDRVSNFSYSDFLNNWDDVEINLKQIKELRLLLDDIRVEGYKIVPIEKLNVTRN